MPTTDTLAELKEIAATVTGALYRHLGRSDSCILTATCIQDILNRDRFRCRVLPVKVLAETIEGERFSVGWERRHAPGYWSGHLIDIVDGQFLVDASLDQKEGRLISIVTANINIDALLRGSDVQINVAGYGLVEYRRHKSTAFRHCGDFKRRNRMQLKKRIGLE